MVDTIPAILAEVRRARNGLRIVDPEAKFAIRAEAGADVAVVDIIGSIGGWFGISAEEIVNQLTAITAPKIRVRINSKGGDVFDGLAIYNALREHPAKVETVVLGVAASIASVIALAGRAGVSVYPASMLMIHDPHAVVVGGAEEMLDMAALLEKTAGLLADVYTARTKKPRDEMRALMKATTWFTGPEARDAGLADAVLDGDPVPEAPAAAVPAVAPAPPAAPWRERARLRATAASLLIGRHYA